MRDASQSSSILTGTKSSKRQRIAIYSSICLVRRSSPPQRQQICSKKIKARFASKSSCKKYVKNNFKKMQNLMNSTQMVSSEHKSMTNHFFRTISQTETKMTVKETKIKASSIKTTWRQTKMTERKPKFSLHPTTPTSQWKRLKSRQARDQKTTGNLSSARRRSTQNTTNV